MPTLKWPSELELHPLMSGVMTVLPAAVAGHAAVNRMYFSIRRTLLTFIALLVFAKGESSQA